MLFPDCKVLILGEKDYYADRSALSLSFRRFCASNLLLLVELAGCAATTILELYKAIFPDNRFRPGIIASTKTFGDLLSWLALIRINENPSLKAEVQKAARMEKNKKKHQPKFVYSQLLQGVKSLLAWVKRMFLFRRKRRARKILLKNYPPMLPFLANPTAFAYALEYGL